MRSWDDPTGIPVLACRGSPHLQRHSVLCLRHPTANPGPTPARLPIAQRKEEGSYDHSAELKTHLRGQDALSVKRLEIPSANKHIMTFKLRQVSTREKLRKAQQNALQHNNL